MIRNFADKTQSIQGSPLIGIRKTIATRMKNSLMNTAQLTETTYADVTELANIRDHFKQKMSWNSWIIYATVQALKNHPYMNGTFEGNYLNMRKKSILELQLILMTACLYQLFSMLMRSH